MLHINYNKASCIIYKKIGLSKNVWQIWILHERQRFQLNPQNATISARTDTRNESGMSTVYRNSSGKIFVGAPNT